MPVVTSSANAKSPAGSYILLPSGASATNYVFNYLSGKLTVTNAQLTIKADDKNRTVNTSNPVLTATVTGFVNGDTINSLTGALKLTTTAPAKGGPPGAYSITASGVSSSSYTITFLPGTMFVNTPPQASNAGAAQAYVDLLDILWAQSNGYTLSRQQLECSTGAAVGSPLLIQSRSNNGALSVNWKFKDVSVGTCWRLSLDIPKLGQTIYSNSLQVNSR